MKVSYEEYIMAVISLSLSLGLSLANWRTVWTRWLFQFLYMWARVDLPAEEGGRVSGVFCYLGGNFRFERTGGEMDRGNVDEEKVPGAGVE